MHSTTGARNRNPIFTVDWLLKVVLPLPTVLRDCGYTVQYIHSSGGTYIFMSRTQQSSHINSYKENFCSKRGT
jgi:hypothetical protein